MGPWGWEAGEEGGPGGLTLGNSESAVVTWKDKSEEGEGEEEEGGWEVRWEGDEGVKGGLRVSMDRKWVEAEDEEVDQERKDDEKKGKEKETKDAGKAFQVTHTTVTASKKKKKK